MMYLSVIWQPALIVTTEALLFLSVMACHSLKDTRRPSVAVRKINLQIPEMKVHQAKDETLSNLKWLVSASTGFAHVKKELQ